MNNWCNSNENENNQNDISFVNINQNLDNPPQQQLPPTNIEQTTMNVMNQEMQWRISPQHQRRRQQHANLNRQHHHFEFAEGFLGSLTLEICDRKELKQKLNEQSNDVKSQIKNDNARLSELTTAATTIISRFPDQNNDSRPQENNNNSHNGTFR